MARARAGRAAALRKTSACIAHEINQPVAALMINTQAALRFLDGPSPNIKESQHALTRVLQLGNRIIEIVRHTRDLVKGVQLQKDDFDINEAIRDIVSLSQDDLIKNDVSVRTRLAPRLPVVRADQIQVQQVILNLITNAVQAMSGVCQGARDLRLSTGRTTSGDILVAVQDSGPGLDAESSDHLFDAFYSTKPRGLGIGLSICRAIIQAHGGRLWVSPGGRHGAKFQFTLPLIRSPIVPQRHSNVKVKECAATESPELRSQGSCHVRPRTCPASDQHSKGIRDRATSASLWGTRSVGSHDARRPSHGRRRERRPKGPSGSRNP